MYITLQQECEWNVIRIWALKLELATGVLDPMVTFRDAYGPKI